MQKIPSFISRFIQNNHVVNFAAYTIDDFWTASCFYAFDHNMARLILLTSKNTRHSQIMLHNPKIVGTISAQITDIQAIKGIQFSATSQLLTKQDTEYHSSLTHYYQCHPFARLTSSDVWLLHLDMIKYT
ncbi:hypothetical protein [[Haemophilus] ducreyi]|uniref:hypothetical protein n=1 Tax=Haemophilus ducreyi TaxID=730 RepID=UPI0006552E6F|nr:hypothetical protein [[Haemophilus] ducreyi]AKO45576.1 hypothetical protein RZ66_04895 [[Haemophilus] ducreyi]AKO46962.1 hypothetical protein RZ67_04805 [[Haemophilus] ducreyi]AKO48306.1 hypothetical protein RZ68_04790 [[Haemophilus] ducreyi]AKO49694.1 hypothetical protein RZ69_04830 [[Haemophilus] ducreyi]ANF61298.1 hypothetical protein A6037_00160 [[Haemophilus] ducreyi]